MSLIQRVKIETLKGTRYKPSKFEMTPHWAEMKALLHKGIKPGLAEMFPWGKAEQKKYGIGERRTIARFLQRYIEKHGFPYKAGVLTKDGLDFITVAHQNDKE